MRTDSLRQRRGRWSRFARSAALLAILMSVATDIQARGGRGGGGGFRGGGGGIRGGSSTSFGRSSDFGRGSFDRGSDSYRSGGTFSRSGDYSRSSRLDGNRSGSKLESNDRPLGGGSASQLPANRPGGGGGSASQLPAGRPGGIGGSGSQLPANRPGEGNRHWRPDCPKCDDGWDGWVDHPIAAGIAIGAIAGAAAAIGTYWYALPPECPPYIWNEHYYYSCNGTFFEPIYEGETIVYVSVPDPSGGSQPPMN